MSFWRGCGKNRFSAGRHKAPDTLHVLRHVDPAAFLVGLNGELGELDAFRSFAECPFERGVDDDVFEEHFPLDFEGVVEVELVGDFGPVCVVVDGGVDVWIPDGAWSDGLMLGPAFAEADDGGAFSAIDLHG